MAEGKVFYSVLSEQSVFVHLIKWAMTTKPISPAHLSVGMASRQGVGDV